MDTLTAGLPPTSNPRAAPEGAPCGAAAELGSGWLVLRNCALEGGGPRISLALLHPGVGVALVDFVPKEANASDRLRRALDARRFPAIFGGYPPIVRAVLPAERLAELGRVLAAAFEAQPPLALAGGDAWIGTARAALEAELPVTAPERLHARQRRASPWRSAVLAALGGAAVGALALVSALPRGDPGGAPHRPVVMASATAPGTDPDLLFEAAPPGDDFTAFDVAAALMSAESVADAETATAPAEPEVAPTATAATRWELPEPTPIAQATGADHQPPNASPSTVSADAPEAVPEPETSAAAVATAVATAPQETEGAAAEVAGAVEERPEPPAPPAPVAAEPPSAPAIGVDPAPRHSPLSATAPADAKDAAPEPRSPPKRVTAPQDPPARPAAPQQPPATAGRRAALPVNAASPAPGAGGEARCRAILVRATMGGSLSDGDKEFLRRGCQPRG